MDISTLFNQVHSLPSIPKIAQDLIRQFDNPHTSLDAVARNIAMDPVIAAKVLRLANSARFRGNRESASVEDAAMRLGFNTLRTLVLASAVTGAFKAPAGFDLKGFWTHSFQVASISRVLAKQRGVAMETAFTCGMMHNIGELLIQTGAPELAERLNACNQGNAAQRTALETLQLGFGFPEVGAELAKRWQLPELIQQAIAYQARPLQAPADLPLPRLLAQAVLIAEALRLHGGANAAALDSLQGPLFDGMDVGALQDELATNLEADKAFAALLD
ncbi:MAG: HDOD domain-containing protein [Gammaproteobacteria bacterium]|nr:HDOD domain-containing protein [Gammaproteobacteria bacterium]MBU1489300.1 HDOD domain-containing protein [Gammaproteobacteria bacterium]MBU2064449.1 HDOD domain-containing protein [Gammaproteobacteria bacterium]MBU2137294.1 HDOD domain-containing protein [Gammaproteobacteria bacterium]MBU2217339.1 HDOD domain-containing protein [Gammaproteobacteria bacterium]